MPIKTVVNKKYLIQQLLILLPLSLSGIFLVTQVISSRSGDSGNTAVQSAPAASQRSASPSGRAANPSGGTSNNRTPLEGDPEPPGIPGDPGGAVPVDGGLGLLLAAGVGYGVKRIYQDRRKGE